MQLTQEQKDWVIKFAKYVDEKRKFHKKYTYNSDESQLFITAAGFCAELATSLYLNESWNWKDHKLPDVGKFVQVRSTFKKLLKPHLIVHEADHGSHAFVLCYSKPRENEWYLLGWQWCWKIRLYCQKHKGNGRARDYYKLSYDSLEPMSKLKEICRTGEINDVEVNVKKRAKRSNRNN